MEYTRFQYEDVVRSRDVDCFGVFKVKYLSQLLSDAAVGHTIELGVDTSTIAREGLTWMLYSAHINVMSMPRCGTRLVVETFPCGCDRLFALRCYDFKDGDGQLLARASSRWLMIDINRRRPVRPTRSVVALNDGLELPSGYDCGTLSLDDYCDDMSVVRSFVSTYDNIDFNGHVTQASYMQFICDSLSFDFHEKNQLLDVEIVYLHEIMPDTNIVSYLSSSVGIDGNIVVHHKLVSLDGQTIHCIAKTIWCPKS